MIRLRDGEMEWDKDVTFCLCCVCKPQAGDLKATSSSYQLTQRKTTFGNYSPLRAEEGTNTIVIGLFNVDCVKLLHWTPKMLCYLSKQKQTNKKKQKTNTTLGDVTVLFSVNKVDLGCLNIAPYLCKSGWLCERGSAPSWNIKGSFWDNTKILIFT